MAYALSVSAERTEVYSQTFAAFLFGLVCELRESKPEAYVVVPVSRVVVVAVRNPTVSCVVVPTAATFHAVRAYTTSTLLLHVFLNNRLLP